MTQPTDADFPPGMVEEISEFLRTDGDRPYGQDLYPEVFQTQMFFPLQRPRELQQMIQTAREVNPKVIMEIGADKGGGLYHWIKAFPDLEWVVACEIRGTPYAGAFDRTFKHLRTLWLSRSSYEPSTVGLVRAALGGRPIDVLFIDGDKTKMLQDFVSYRPLMNPRGLVFIHDVTDREPRQAFEMLKSQGYDCRLIINRADSNEALEREEQGAAVANPHEGWLRHWAGRSCGVGVVRLGMTEEATSDVPPQG